MQKADPQEEPLLKSEEIETEEDDREQEMEMH
jgi:hypothetical protein